MTFKVGDQVQLLRHSGCHGGTAYPETIDVGAKGEVIEEVSDGVIVRFPGFEGDDKGRSSNGDGGYFITDEDLRILSPLELLADCSE